MQAVYKRWGDDQSAIALYIQPAVVSYRQVSGMSWTVSAVLVATANALADWVMSAEPSSHWRGG